MKASPPVVRRRGRHRRPSLLARLSSTLRSPFTGPERRALGLARGESTRLKARAAVLEAEVVALRATVDDLTTQVMALLDAQRRTAAALARPAGAGPLAAPPRRPAASRVGLPFSSAPTPLRMDLRTESRSRRTA